MNGVETSTRSIVTPGTNCPPLERTRGCKSSPLPKCIVSEWSVAGPCVDGVATSSRIVLEHGTDCPPLERSEPCHADNSVGAQLARELKQFITQLLWPQQPMHERQRV